jgi:hypothetical protein
MLPQVGAKSAGHVHTCSGRIAIAESRKEAVDREMGH